MENNRVTPIETEAPVQLSEKDFLKERVFNLIKQCTGKENGITRLDLVIATGCSDQVVRGYIKELRQDGHVICSSSHTVGYYVPADEVEFKTYIEEYRAKAYKMIKIAEEQESQFSQNFYG